MAIAKTEKRSFCLLGLLTLVWTAFIFWHSLQNGEASTRESQSFLLFLQRIFPALSHGLLRKLGHLTEFTILGLLLGLLSRHKWAPGGWQRLAPPLRSLLFPALFGLITAAADESIQTFIPGRSGEFRDVLIDFSGVCLGLLMVFLASRLFRLGKDA